MTTMVCLANSWKGGGNNRCIAGIDMETGRWLRPCFGSGEEGIPWQARQIEGREPALLDLLEMPLADDGPHREYQPENRQLLPGSWRKVGTATLTDVLQYCEEGGFLLGNFDRRVPAEEALKLPQSERKSLCLLQTRVHFTTGSKVSRRTGIAYEAVFAAFQYGAHHYQELDVTDADFAQRFPTCPAADVDCVLTVSRGSPYGGYCYKLVAGVIPLLR